MCSITVYLTLIEPTAVVVDVVLVFVDFVVDFAVVVVVVVDPRNLSLTFGQKWLSKT